MLGVTTTWPDFGSTTPGTATPMAVRSVVSSLAWVSTSCITVSIIDNTCSGPPVRGVDCRCLPRMAPDSLTSEA